MNERIRELQIQADEYADEIFDRKGKMYGEIVMERFAELIVRECQRRVEQYINECGEAASMPDTVIMKHFGVEE